MTWRYTQFFLFIFDHVIFLKIHNSILFVSININIIVTSSWKSIIKSIFYMTTLSHEHSLINRDIHCYMHDRGSNHFLSQNFKFNTIFFWTAHTPPYPYMHIFIHSPIIYSWMIAPIYIHTYTLGWAVLGKFICRANSFVVLSTTTCL